MKLQPGYETRPDDSYFQDCVKTPLTEEEATYYLKTAWKNIFNIYPNKDSLALLWAQSLGETGRWKLLRNFNWGNIKRKSNNQKYTSYEAGEYLNRKYQLFYPYHPQTFFAAWDSPLEGAEAYIRFLSGRSRYAKAWVCLMAGDPVQYCAELKKAGYFTDKLEHYTKGVVSLTNEFKSKADRLMAWEPPPEAPEEPPEPVLKPEPTPEPPQEEKPSEPDSAKPKPNRNFWTFLVSILKKLAPFLKK